ncbi:MAG: thermonuclease family protein [Zestosphaera sp.]
MNKKLGLLILVIIFLTLTTAIIPKPIKASDGVGIHDDFPHARVVVTHVVDGDTIHISPPVYVQGSYRTVVRLADIDAPELNQPEGAEAREALIGLLANYSGVVLLDIDKSENAVDEYGRVIAVAYVRVDDTTLLNVNKWMVENEYASIEDLENDFNPSKWSLYITYEKEKEKLPTINKIPLYTGDISYGTSWGVRVATTPDHKYLGVAFSEYGGDWALRIYVVSKDGDIVREYRYGPDKYSSDPTQSKYANVFRGMIDIAANETGFLLVWTNYTRRVGTTSKDRTVLYSYVPVDPDLEPTTPQHIYHGYNQYHPTVTHYIHQDGSKWWVVGYSSQTSTIGRYTINLLNSMPSYTSEYKYAVIYSGSPVPKIGVDVMGGLLFDEVTRRFYIVARGYNLGGDNTAHDMVGIYGNVTTGYDLSVPSPHCVDCREGDQGPSATTYAIGSSYYSYYNVYPMYTAGLLSGGRVLTVYNESSTSLIYAVVDLTQETPGVVRSSLVSVGSSTTFYPWIASNETHWLVAWNTLGWANLSVIDVSGSSSGVLTLADRNASFVKVAYDLGSGKFIIPYAVNELDTGQRNLVVAFYNSVGGVLEPWVLPVGMDRNTHNTPLHVKILGGEDGGSGKIAIVALEGGSLVLYLIGSEYPELQSPVPIPEPVWVVIPVVLVTAFLVLRGLRPKKD